MSEKSKNHEASPIVCLFQVVGVPAHGGIRRSVVVQILDDPKFVGTSEILHEGSKDERLAFAGTSNVETLQPTEEIWDRTRVVDGLIATFGNNDPDIRSKVEKLFVKDL